MVIGDGGESGLVRQPDGLTGDVEPLTSGTGQAHQDQSLVGADGARC